MQNRSTGARTRLPALPSDEFNTRYVHTHRHARAVTMQHGPSEGTRICFLGVGEAPSCGIPVTRPSAMFGVRISGSHSWSVRFFFSIDHAIVRRIVPLYTSTQTIRVHSGGEAHTHTSAAGARRQSPIAMTHRDARHLRIACAYTRVRGKPQARTNRRRAEAECRVNAEGPGQVDGGQRAKAPDADVCRR